MCCLITALNKIITIPTMAISLPVLLLQWSLRNPPSTSLCDEFIYKCQSCEFYIIMQLITKQTSPSYTVKSIIEWLGRRVEHKTAECTKQKLATKPPANHVTVGPNDKKPTSLGQYQQLNKHELGHPYILHPMVIIYSYYIIVISRTLKVV